MLGGAKKTAEIGYICAIPDPEREPRWLQIWRIASRGEFGIANHA